MFLAALGCCKNPAKNVSESISKAEKSGIPFVLTTQSPSLDV